MRARVVAGVVGRALCLFTAAAGAQAQTATFPSDAASSTPTPAAAPMPAAAPAGEAPPITTAPTATPGAPASVPVPARPISPPPVPTEATQPKAVPSWNVGAGIFSNSGLGALSGLGVGYAAGLERRLGRRAWLALNARGAYVSREAPVSPTNADPNPAGTYRVRTSSASALLGVRYVFAHGLVDVSGSAAAYLDYQHIENDEPSGSLQLESGSKRELGLLLGMAVERELIEALALRLSLDLASASAAFYDSPRIDDVGVKQPRTLVTGRLGFAVEPGLHLHFYF